MNGSYFAILGNEPFVHSGDSRETTTNDGEIPESMIPTLVKHMKFQKRMVCRLKKA